MHTLFIDTATDRSLIALGEEDQLKALLQLPQGTAASHVLLTSIDQFLREQELTCQQLDCIACGQGPGSYTGIRVGAAAAKCLALACSLPLVGVCSLVGFIPSSLNRDGAFCSLIDARSGGAFAMRGRLENGQIVEQGPAQRVPWDQLLTFLDGTPRLITPNRALLESHFIPFKENAGDWQWEERSLNAEYMLLKAYEKFRSGEFSNCSELELLYLREDITNVTQK